MNGTSELAVRKWLKRHPLPFELLPTTLAGLINYSFCFGLEKTCVPFCVISHITVFLKHKSILRNCNTLILFLWYGEKVHRVFGTWAIEEITDMRQSTRRLECCGKSAFLHGHQLIQKLDTKILKTVFWFFWKVHQQKERNRTVVLIASMNLASCLPGV